MRAAVEAGIAPAVHHADADGRRGDHGFRAGNARCPTIPAERQVLVRDLGSLVARLQATPAFPPVSDYLVA